MNKRALMLSLFLLLCFVIQPFEPSTVHAEGLDIFVSADGTGTDCTQAAPCQPSQGLVNATDGDTIYFAEGTYTSSTTDPILTVTKGVALVGGWDGAPTGVLVIDPDDYEAEFDGGGSRGLFRINSPSDVYDVSISGFVLRYGRTQFGGAIEVLDGKTIIENNGIKENYASSYGGGVYALAQDELVIRNNLFFSNTAKFGGGGVHLNRPSESEAAVIENNIFLANATENDGYGGAIDVSRSAAIINANRIANTENTSSTIMVSSGALVHITNNFIYWDTYASGNAVAVEIWYDTGEEAQVINNTIVNAHLGINDVLKGKANITNNIFYNCWKSINLVTGSNFVGTNNLFYNNTSDPLLLSNPVTGLDPLFVNAASQNYHIQKDSPAVDAGAVVTLDHDFDGDARPIGDGYDIGADEWNIFQNYLPLILR